MGCGNMQGTLLFLFITPTPLETDCNTTWALLDRVTCYVSSPTQHISYGFLNSWQFALALTVLFRLQNRITIYPVSTARDGQNRMPKVRLNIAFTLRAVGRVAQSVQRLATGWTVRWSNPNGGKIFRTCPDRTWGPPILLYNGYRVFPDG
jgi:hypothetical protein